MIQMFENNVTIYFMICFYYFLMNYLKIEYNARKVKILDYYDVNENI